MIRALLAGVVLSVAVLIRSADPAVALPILDPADADELAAELSDVTAVQGICYGWHVTLRDEQTGLTGVDHGSSRGVGQDVHDASCPQWMLFDARVTYTSSSSESEDSATFQVVTNVRGGPDASDLRRVGISGDALLGAEDDLAIVNATLALPALASELGLAPPPPLEVNSEPIPPADRPTGRPGSDWTRSYGHFILLSVVLVVGGAGWAGWAWGSERYGWNRRGGDDS